MQLLLITAFSRFEGGVFGRIGSRIPLSGCFAVHVRITLQIIFQRADAHTSMPQRNEYTEYALLAQTRTTHVQNPQELASIWGSIRNECEAIGADISRSYAALGEYDFLVLLDAPSRDVCFKASLILERHGLDVQSMEVVPTDAFGDLVEDI